MIFDVLNSEKIWHQQLVLLPTSPVYCSHFTLGNLKSYFSTVLLNILKIIYVVLEENVKFSQDLTHQRSLKSLNFWQTYFKNKKVDVFWGHSVDLWILFWGVSE